MRNRKRDLLEMWFRAQRIPFVDVREARKAILPGGDHAPGGMGDHLPIFDYVAYQSNGVNLLVLVAPRRTPRRVRTMKRWADIFGEPFRPVFAWPIEGGGPYITGIDGPAYGDDCPEDDAPCAVPSPSPVSPPVRRMMPSTQAQLALFGGGA
jgi:hypothetical protein